MMNERGKSDDSVVPKKSPNTEGAGTNRTPPAEGMEGRGSAEGNPQERNTLRTLGRERVQQALARVRQVAASDKEVRFTALLHHVYNPDTLREAFFLLKRDAAPGVDGETWRHYGEDLEASLLDLSDRLKRGAYRTGINASLRERRCERSRRVVAINANRGPRLDADIRGFFDTIDHEWLVKFGEHRIADKRVVRLIRKWLNAGVLETVRKRLSAKLGNIKAELRRRLHHPIPATGKWLRSVVEGHTRYYGVPMNGPAIALFRFAVGRLWHRALSRRSQKGRVTWERMYRLIDRYLPAVRACHPYPLQRLGVITRGRSRMR